MDNKGRVTVVLHWDQRNQNNRGSGNGGMDASPSKKTIAHQQNTLGVGDLLMENNNQLKRESEQLYQHHQSVSPNYRHGTTPQITVIHHDAMLPSMTDRLLSNIRYIILKQSAKFRQ